MSKEISKLYPQNLWKHFYDLTQIPRPSKNEAGAIAFVKKFGEDLGLETIVDETGNVIIRKPATPGMENRKGIILQGHLDMVPQANSDSKHDFIKDPIPAYIDGEWVTADGTTLGADNGIGVAAAMAVLEADNLRHGPVEGLFTIDEETGMTGAFGLKPGILKGDILINMDSEDEGELYVGCAGGTNANISFDFKPQGPTEGHIGLNIWVKGLKGGHSGLDIPLERGNSNKILFRFLYEVLGKYDIKLGPVNGGSLRNAIPRESFITISIPVSQAEGLEKDLAEFTAVVKKELSSADPGLETGIEKTDMPVTFIDGDTAARLIRTIYACPNGVMRMSTDMKGLVETSTNLATVKTDGHQVKIQCLLRSSVDSSKEDLKNMFSSIIELAGGNIDFDGEYQGWKPDMNSRILKSSQEVYNKLFGKIPEIKAIHAGLECGILGGIYPNWDMISFGPTIRFPHSPDEKVNIETVGKFWDFLVGILEDAPSS